MAVTLMAMCDAISDTLATATGIESTKGFDEITTAIPADQCPRIQVYTDSIGPAPDAGQTSQATFNMSVQPLDIPIFVDLYARKRSWIWLDMEAMLTSANALVDVIQAQRKPYFGMSYIQSFSWTFKRGVMQYGKSMYMGGRFIITARVF